MQMVHQAAALGLAFLTAIVVTPIFRKFAISIGLVDRPDPTRKLHKDTVALSGGVAVLLSCGVACALSLLSFRPILNAVLLDIVPVLGLIGASVGIVTLGLVDDKFALRGRQKLAGQILCVSVLVLVGFRMNSISLFGWDVHLGLLAIPVSIGWLLLTVNALNLIDGADGLCSTVGWTAAAGFAGMATLGNHMIEASIAAALAGALLGFLVYNFPPAKIFLGDAGSMFIGLVLGALALRTSLKEATAISMLVPVTILAIPLFDSSMAILRRKLTGRSIFTVDRGHLHHNLLKRGYSSHKLVLIATVLCGLVSLGGFLGHLFNNDLIAVAALIISLGALIGSKIFGHAELTLLVGRVIHFGKTLLARNGKSDNLVRQHMIRLQGVRSWEKIWDSLVEFAEKHDLAKVCLDLNVPWLHEGFHANWQRNKMPDVLERWATKLPVDAGGRLIGRLEVVGKLQSESAFVTLSALSDMLASLQPEIARLISETPIPHKDVAMPELATPRVAVSVLSPKDGEPAFEGLGFSADS